MEFATPLHAQEAVNVGNNCKLDKHHTFLINLFTDFSKYERIPEIWEPPTPQPYQGQADHNYYLLEPDAYDQFCVVIGQGNSVQMWQNTQPEPTVLEDRNVSPIFTSTTTDLCPFCPNKAISGTVTVS